MRRAGQSWILVLEDDEDFRRFLARALTGHGYAVVDTGDPVEALHLLESNERFELLLADVKMQRFQPLGTSIGKMAAVKRPRLSIIYMTGDPGAVPAGAIDPKKTPLVLKPVRVETLLRLVEKSLQRSSPASP